MHVIDSYEANNDLGWSLRFRVFSVCEVPSYPMVVKSQCGDLGRSSCCCVLQGQDPHGISTAG